MLGWAGPSHAEVRTPIAADGGVLSGDDVIQGDYSVTTTWRRVVSTLVRQNSQGRVAQ